MFTKRSDNLSPGPFLLAYVSMRRCFQWMLLLLALPGLGAERKFDFANVRENEAPPGFRSALTGKGRPGNWKVILEDVPSLLPPLTSQPSPSHARHSVLAQLAQDPTDEH